MISLLYGSSLLIINYVLLEDRGKTLKLKKKNSLCISLEDRGLSCGIGVKISNRWCDWEVTL